MLSSSGPPSILSEAVRRAEVGERRGWATEGGGKEMRERDFIFVIILTCHFKQRLTGDREGGGNVETE